MLGHRILREHLEAQAIPFVDLTDAFRRATAAETLYLERDTHWNAAGNRLAAAVLAQYLTEQTPLATRATAAVAP